MKVTGANERAAEIMDKFAHDKFPPVLDEAEAILVIDSLRARHMEPSNSVRMIGTEPVPTEVMLSQDGDIKRAQEINPGALIGPYVLGDEYYPDGISIWRATPSNTGQ